MRMFSRFVVTALFVTATACGGSGGGGGGDAGIDATVELPDEDGDGIADIHEGRDQDTDTDGDGTPDYLDEDSDGDGIPDYRESGDDLTATPPLDSDGDGTPDFQDTDADDNGLADGVDGVDDLDNDGIGNFADLDDDGDSLTDVFEMENAATPTDTDGDGTPDYQDVDSDNDTIKDLHEKAEDPDNDLIPAFRDLDSDGDCRLDAIEAGDVALNTPPVDSDADLRADFLDLDSDNDGLADSAEDADCDGAVSAGESSATAQDTDGDGVSDLIEVSAGTDPQNAADNPQANGDFVFVVPYQQPTTPTQDDLDFSTNLQIVDLYVLVDRSGSMTDEITSVRDNLATVVRNLACPPLGNGDPSDCIADLYSGSGTIGYSGSGPAAYTNVRDLQANPTLATSGMVIGEPSGCCAETTMLGLWSTVTGKGSAASGCSISGGAIPNRTTCPAGRLGWPCFRPNALPVILLATDEAPNTGGDTYHCPAQNTVVAAANAIGAKVIGIYGSGGGTGTTNDLNALATGTGAVDASAGNAPLVFSGSGTGTAAAIELGVRKLANGVPLDISALPVDDPADTVDAVVEFVNHLETLQLGTPACANMLTDQDSNMDGFKDLYIDVLPGTPVCWRVIPKNNTTVPATTVPQLFKATVEVMGDNVTLLDTRDVYFLVPPVPVDIPVN